MPWGVENPWELNTLGNWESLGTEYPGQLRISGNWIPWGVENPWELNTRRVENITGTWLPWRVKNPYEVNTRRVENLTGTWLPWRVKNPWELNTRGVETPWEWIPRGVETTWELNIMEVETSLGGTELPGELILFGNWKPEIVNTPGMKRNKILFEFLKEDVIHVCIIKRKRGPRYISYILVWYQEK